MGGDRPGRGGAGAPASVTALVVEAVDRELPVHPRMHRRRLAVRRDARRRRITWALGGVGVVALLLGAYVATRTALLDVDRIEVGGAGRTATGDILTALGVEVGDPMLDVDAGSVARRIEALPWVDEARVRREWPGTVRVEVTERRPVAVVEAADGAPALVDREGRVLAIGDVPDGRLVAIDGIEGPAAAVGEQIRSGAQDALAVAEAVSAELPGVVAAVNVDLEAELVAGGTARFGSVEDLDEKLVALETVLADVDVACLDVLDLRVPPNAALTRRQGCS